MVPGRKPLDWSTLWTDEQRHAHAKQAAALRNDCHRQRFLRTASIRLRQHAEGALS